MLSYEGGFWNGFPSRPVPPTTGRRWVQAKSAVNAIDLRHPARELDNAKTLVNT